MTRKLVLGPKLKLTLLSTSCVPGTPLGTIGLVGGFTNDLAGQNNYPSLYHCQGTTLSGDSLEPRVQQAFLNLTLQKNGYS
jgi:hypothetical protein